ncbi:immunity 51 family protein [Streptococcus oralis]|uniref:Immunity protein 51 n=2 Tax=Streptococcus oralis TaxID=1303 RepID=J5GRV7_STROR|nr:MULTISPECIES: Imm51 family immunity protein [Streptococcus]EFM35334.1 hypothetical protein HMPREF9189_0983 [Streptococcus sp. oral taxon 071 str. 73H25AP]EJP20828.1 hypothetical protein HMPREF1125_0977 [Streptococcus oralis SK304]EKS18813.1 hypothetical protein HMPREF9188_00879 [Streptococcus sp. F0441]MCY7064623.1 immunity 51 family protein [Streptococcus oralis]MCY7071544.1 immunity 51 family protein [Streptococcus oralis]
MIDYKMVNKKISPFKFLVHDEETQSVRGSLIYYPGGEYRQEVFDTREDEGFEGNGYDWASLALIFLEEKMPELSESIDFDPEGSMFCAYSSNIDALATFALGFKEFCDDSESMIDLFSRAELD